jgi:hypothetical protein
VTDPLSALIESRELEVICGHCGWAGHRPLSWLSSHRDMNCPTCAGVIVLNTSERRREIMAVRRQVSALHDQLAGSLTVAEGIMAASASKPRSETPKPELTLLHQLRDNKWPSLNDTGKYRRIARARR